MGEYRVEESDSVKASFSKQFLPVQIHFRHKPDNRVVSLGHENIPVSAMSDAGGEAFQKSCIVFACKELKSVSILKKRFPIR